MVPIVADEARTFGMEGLFRQIGIYNPDGQQYTPVDKDQVMYYKEDKAGQILQEGINEAGGMSSWIAAATSYSTNNRIMVPFYVYYSMFGFQRIGDLAWAAGDMQARGFLLGGTSGRTTLNGEGLQHEDGHSHILANTIPNCVSYDPTFAHEVGVILHHGLKRMVEKQDNVYYYLTLLNENYAMPGLQPGTEEQIIKGMYLAKQGPAVKAAKGKDAPTVQLLGSGTILRESFAAQELLEKDWGVSASVWSCPSFNELTRDGQDADRWNCATRAKTPRVPFVSQQPRQHWPAVASTDYMKAYAEQIRPSPRAKGCTEAWPQRLRANAARALRNQSPLHRRAALKALSEDGVVPVPRCRKRSPIRHRRQGQPALRLNNNHPTNNQHSSRGDNEHGSSGSEGSRHRRLRRGRGHRGAGQGGRRSRPSSRSSRWRSDASMEIRRRPASWRTQGRGRQQGERGQRGAGA